jgi:hypothetical protein
VAPFVLVDKFAPFVDKFTLSIIAIEISSIFTEDIRAL